MGTLETVRCKQESREMCLTSGTPCRKHTGKCAADGLCCTQGIEHVCYFISEFYLIFSHYIRYLCSIYDNLIQCFLYKKFLIIPTTSKSKTTNINSSTYIHSFKYTLRYVMNEIKI